MTASKPAVRRGRPPKNRPRARRHARNRVARRDGNTYGQGFVPPPSTPCSSIVRLPRAPSITTSKASCLRPGGAPALGAVLPAQAGPVAAGLTRTAAATGWAVRRRRHGRMPKYHFKRGCLVGNLGQEVAILPESFRQALDLR